MGSVGRVATAVVAAVAVAAVSTPADAAPADRYDTTTAVGVHNAYDKAKYPYFADALDSGASLVELDVWTNVFGSPWRVAHSNPVGNDNNCANAADASALRTGPTDHDLGGCLADMKAWHDAHPGHRPVLVKVEMKDGFNDKGGRGPDEFDALVRSHLGDAVFGPGDLAGTHATLDDAVRTDGWPARSALAGKFLFELIPGTVEENNPLDKLWTDQEYATHLRDLAGQGRLAEATAFPAVHGAEAGDPRERYAQDLRPWFVVFDGDASAFVAGAIDTAWYDRNHYLVVMTDAQNVAPAIDAVKPTEAEALARVDALARQHASFATADWYPLPNVLQTVVARG
ncbi:phosphatidylinositol-specific phospholipase C domain-containing protein [Streptomyces sp. NPDC059740]|uniref:phosphatidylinositol-specific phospholipase C domain-containing protein n=1 Tax=Streptomyces sp. NPDC059740 TaxID=3346926 RepID=UPI00366A0299